MGKVAPRKPRKDKQPEPEVAVSAEVTMDASGRIVIPRAVREALGLKGGEKLRLEASPRGIRLMTRLMALRALQELAAKYKKPGESIVDEFIAEKRAEAARE